MFLFITPCGELTKRKTISNADKKMCEDGLFKIICVSHVYPSQWKDGGWYGINEEKVHQK